MCASVRVCNVCVCVCVCVCVWMCDKWVSRCTLCILLVPCAYVLALVYSINAAICVADDDFILAHKLHTIKAV